MSSVRCRISMSLDGYVAGPNQSFENPLGEGGELLHEWMFATATWQEQHGRSGGERGVDDEIVERATTGIGAYIMGRGMFGGGHAEWDPAWKGWWGDDPPYHVPVFVLTHFAREPLEMEGGTTFVFVTEGIEAAFEAARSAAGEDDIAIAGGASTVNQYLRAGLIEELLLHIAPRLLGGGARLFEDVGDLALEPVEVTPSALTTHVRYRVGGR